VSLQDQVQIVKGLTPSGVGGFLQQQRDNQLGAANMLGRGPLQT